MWNMGDEDAFGLGCQISSFYMMLCLFCRIIIRLCRGKYMSMYKFVFVFQMYGNRYLHFQKYEYMHLRLEIEQTDG